MSIPKNGNWYQAGLSAAAPTGAAYARPVVGTTKTQTNVKYDDFSFSVSSSPIVDANKALEWNLNTGSGTVAVDTSGHSNNGTISGAAWTSGLIGNALSFDGVNNQVTASGLNHMPTDANANSWSMNVYVYMDSDTYDANHVDMRICGFGTDAWGSDANYLDGSKMGHGRSIGEIDVREPFWHIYRFAVKAEDGAHRVEVRLVNNPVDAHNQRYLAADWVRVN